MPFVLRTRFVETILSFQTVIINNPCIAFSFAYFSFLRKRKVSRIPRIPSHADQIEIPSGNIRITAEIELVIGAERVYLQGQGKDILASVVCRD